MVRAAPSPCAWAWRPRISRPRGGIPVHLHDRGEEILFFHEGRGEMLIEGEAHLIEAEMGAFVPPGVTHGV
ncbi:MAG: cupin domain-containing protein [Candidatus Tectomicrobia bacterium]|nr:cupin domain-containing protein [Candidatus Tectomicrobia bacterium]